MAGTLCLKLKNAPDEHMGEKVPVVTTSTVLAASSAPFSSTISIISSAVATTTCADLIFSLISALVLLTRYPAIPPFPSYPLKIWVTKQNVQDRFGPSPQISAQTTGDDEVARQPPEAPPRYWTSCEAISQ